MTTTSPKVNITEMSFEESLQELEQVIKNLEEGRLPLDQSIEIFERGSALQKHCQTLLQSAKLKVEEIYQTKDGEMTTKESPLTDLFG